MQNSTNPQPTPTDPSIEYGPVFARYLAGALRQSLTQVQEHRYTVPEDVRIQAWHMLRLTLDVDALWEQASELLIELAPRMEMAGFRQDWIPYLEAGVARSEELGDGLSQATLLYYLGQIFRMMGLYKKSTNYLNRSEEIFVACSELNSQAMVLNEKAYMEFYQGDYPATQKLAENAIALFDDDHPELAMSYYHLGMIAEANSRWEESRTFYQRALDIRRQHGDLRKTASNLRNIGQVYMRVGQYERAIVQYHQAMQIHEKQTDPFQQALTQIALGIAYRRLNKFSDTLVCYQRAESTFIGLSDEDNLAVVYNNMGLVYEDMGNLFEANRLLTRSINIRKQINNPLLLAGTMESLGQIYVKQNDYSKAAEVYEEALNCISIIPNVRSLPIYEGLKTNLDNIIGTTKRHV